MKTALQILLDMNDKTTAAEIFAELKASDFLKHPDDSPFDIEWSNGRGRLSTQECNAIDIIYSRWEQVATEEGKDIYDFLIAEYED